MVKSKIKANKKNVKKLAVLEKSKNEIQKRFDIENQNLSNIEQNNRDFEKYVDKSPFDFNDIDQYDNENNLNEFIDIPENNKTKYDRTPVFDIILDSQRDNCFLLFSGELIINDGEPFQLNRFYEDSNQLIKSNEKMIDRYDERLEVLFSGSMIKFTNVFNQITRSIYGKACDAF